MVHEINDCYSKIGSPIETLETEMGPVDRWLANLRGAVLNPEASFKFIKHSSLVFKNKILNHQDLSNRTRLEWA